MRRRISDPLFPLLIPTLIVKSSNLHTVFVKLNCSVGPVQRFITCRLLSMYGALDETFPEQMLPWISQSCRAVEMW